MAWCSFLLQSSKRSVGTNSYNMERYSDFVTMGFAFNQELCSIFLMTKFLLKKRIEYFYHEEDELQRRDLHKALLCTEWIGLSSSFPLRSENATVERKIHLRLTGLRFAPSLTLSWRTETRGRPCPSGPPPQDRCSSSWDLLCPFAHFWHLMGFITSRAVFLLLRPIFFLQKHSISFSSTLPASVRNATTQSRLYALKTNPQSY